MSRGRHCRPSRTAPVIAAAGTAAASTAIILSPAAAQAVTVSPHPAADDVTAKVVEVNTPSLPQVVTVRRGDYLSKIAAEDCGNQKFWTGILAANKSKISNPDLIYPGERLKLSCREAPVPVIATVTDAVSATLRYHHHYVQAANISTAGMGGFQACVISRESGGNSQVMNSSGHYGLYQFSSSTWEAYGGSAADFGHASVSEQNRVFNNAMAQGGEFNWSPYDGC